MYTYKITVTSSIPIPITPIPIPDHPLIIREANKNKTTKINVIFVDFFTSLINNILIINIIVFDKNPIPMGVNISNYSPTFLQI